MTANKFTLRNTPSWICPFNGNCDVPSTRFKVSVNVLVHASITYVSNTQLSASHARFYCPSRVRPQFHLLLRHVFPLLFRFSRIASARSDLFLCVSFSLPSFVFFLYFTMNSTSTVLVFLPAFFLAFVTH